MSVELFPGQPFHADDCLIIGIERGQIAEPDVVGLCERLRIFQIAHVARAECFLSVGQQEVGSRQRAFIIVFQRGTLFFIFPKSLLVLSFKLAGLRFEIRLGDLLADFRCLDTAFLCLAENRHRHAHLRDVEAVARRVAGFSICFWGDERLVEVADAEIGREPRFFHSRSRLAEGDLLLEVGQSRVARRAGCQVGQSPASQSHIGGNFVGDGLRDALDPRTLVRARRQG